MKKKQPEKSFSIFDKIVKFFSRVSETVGSKTDVGKNDRAFVSFNKFKKK